MKLQGKVAMITGAGSGMGQATALLFAREGAAVAALDINGAGAEETAVQIRADGGRALALRCDVTRPAENQAALEATLREFGQVDIYYANAGIGMAFTPFEETPEALVDRLIGVNLKGAILGLQSAVPAIKASHGVILVTASTAGHRPRPGLTVYNCTKGALITLTKSLALELAPHGVRVNCISPVMTETPMATEIFLQGEDPAAARRRVLSTIPLGRLNTPADIARTALFLASDDAAMITGVSLEVDGGRDV